MATLLDTNAILRYLLAEEACADQVAQAREAVLSGAYTLPEIVAECVYVLTSKAIYDLPRDEVANALTIVLGEVECERTVILLRALELFSKTRLSFVDCVVAATAEIDATPVLTFDKALRRLIDAEDPRG